MTDEPRGCSPPCSQGTTFIHQATPLENQNFADLLAPKPSKGRLPKQAKQVVQAPTGLSSSLFNPEIRKEVQRTTARVALSEAMPVLTPLPPNHEALRKRRASKSPDKAGHNAPKITALKHMYTNAQRATLAKLNANAEAPAGSPYPQERTRQKWSHQPRTTLPQKTFTWTLMNSHKTQPSMFNAPSQPRTARIKMQQPRTPPPLLNEYTLSDHNTSVQHAQIQGLSYGPILQRPTK